MFGFVPDFPQNGWQRSPAEHLEDPTAYILQLTVSDGKSQKADIQRMDGKENILASRGGRQILLCGFCP